MVDATPLDEIDAIARAQGPERAVKVYLAAVILAARRLTQPGGREAAAEVLEATRQQVLAGSYDDAPGSSGETH